MKMERKICIIGAGISGLLACKYALSKGFQPLVFESQTTIGGVWTKTLEITKLQSPKPWFQFIDFPWPCNVEALHPNKDQVYDYIKSYAKHFDLLKHIIFNTKVLSIRYEGPSIKEVESWDLWGGNGDPFGNKGKWFVTTQDVLNHSTKVYQVDFVILCIGRYSGLPNMPEFPLGKGPEVFEGKVMHSMEFSELDNECARELIKGKRVTVVGWQKSALDIAKQCSDTNGVEHPCTVIYRTPYWSTPDLFPLGICIAYLYMTRFSELLLHKPGEGHLLGLLATILSPLRWGISKLVEIDIMNKLPLKKYDLVPDHSFLQAVNTCSLSIVPEKLYDNIEKGSIILKRSSTYSFYKQGIMLEDIDFGSNEPIKSDLVIFATGFKGEQKLKDMFECDIFQDYIFGSHGKTIPLYRECIHPRIPQLAVIGYSESLANLYTSEMRCRWLIELLDGKFKVPSIEKMEKDILEWEKFMKRYSGKYHKKSAIGALHIWYNDQICKDMGLNPKRKNGFWAELFEPYGPSDYA